MQSVSVRLLTVQLSYVMLCYVMLCYVMLCYVMLCYEVAATEGQWTVPAVQHNNTMQLCYVMQQLQ